MSDETAPDRKFESAGVSFLQRSSPTPTSLAHARLTLEKAYAFFDAHDHIIRRQVAKDGSTISCHKGCFACCREPVYVYEHEVHYMLGCLTPEEIEALKPKVKIAIDTLEASGLLEEIEPKVWGWRPLNMWCPLLKDGLCSVYQNRPLACRAHIAIGPSHHCEDNELRRQQKFLNTPDLNRHVSQRIMFGSLEEDGEACSDHLIVLLAEILLGRNVKSSARVKVVKQGEEITVYKWTVEGVEETDPGDRPKAT
jgi:Fe-S-cluster containining protein